MDSAKIFALGLTAGLAIHALMRKQAQKNTTQSGSKSQAPIAPKSNKKTKNKKKSKDATSAAAATEPAKLEAVEEQPPAAVVEEAPSYAAVAETTPAINNDTIRAKADAAQTAFTASLGDMRDAEVDPLPAGYSSVARIPAPEAAASKPKLSKKDLDDGWSSVGGTFPSTTTSAASKVNGSSTTVKSSIASNNPFAALPDDATTSSVRRIPAKPTTTSNGGWTVASSSSKPKNTTNGVTAETKKQRSNANKTQAKKAAKEEADRLQAERLANHRRQQASEAAKLREKAARPTPKSVPGSSKLPNAKASVDLNGRLVWD
ncbi:hypothetical protein [Sporisorium scitamineum]|uniref:Uncharacterized protein n=1 Tax=Sporisorium scitamineum TaxID=49012 RepID=A0A0F7S1F9_9BASI|nr:hypothetical protein [Sporisorium scitamineum]